MGVAKNNPKNKEDSQSEIKQGEIYVYLIILYWKEKESQLLSVKVSLHYYIDYGMESTWYLKDTKQVAKPQRVSEFSGACSRQVLNWQRKPTCLLLALSRAAKAKLSSVFPLPFHMQQFVF